MATTEEPQIREKTSGPCVKQFSVFLLNRVGALLEIVRMLNESDVHVLALNSQDSTDSATRWKISLISTKSLTAFPIFWSLRCGRWRWISEKCCSASSWRRSIFRFVIRFYSDRTADLHSHYTWTMQTVVGRSWPGRDSPF